MSDSQKQAMADLAFIEAQADFAVDLLRELSVNATASLILSPISIALALSLAYAGSNGNTRQQFDSVFAKGQSNNDLNTFFQTTLNELGDPRNVTLDIANRAYAEKSLKILDSYKQLITSKYGGDFALVDFKTMAHQAVKDINSFVEEKTRNKIKNLVSDDSVNSDTRLILINAIYFKGDWANKFDKARTSEKSFFVSENNEKKVQMMKKTFKTGYAETDEVQVLELPYVDKDVTFVAFLPKKRFGLNEFVQGLNGKKLLELKGKIHEQEVNIELPRFKIESEFGLKPVLSKLGLENGFGAEANFSGITTDEQLYISDVIHKGFVETNEQGSEAAAATAVIMNRKSMPSRPRIIPNFHANQPFVFGIYLQNRPLFIGKYIGVDA